MSETARWVLVAAAATMGAIGVGLGAAAAHRVSDTALVTAAQFMVMHAAAALGLIALATRCRAPAAWLFATILLLSGTALFAGDIALRAFAGQRLFPMAAPIGGSGMIAGWAMAMLAAILELRAAAK
ncbi:MAG: DUF423 domain-containing protein [Hyphomicrobiaceae bacterium]